MTRNQTSHPCQESQLFQHNSRHLTPNCLIKSSKIGTPVLQSSKSCRFWILKNMATEYVQEAMAQQTTNAISHPWSWQRDVESLSKDDAERAKETAWDLGAQFSTHLLTDK